MFWQRADSAGNCVETLVWKDNLFAEHLRPERDDAQRRQGEFGRIGSSVTFMLDGDDSAHVPDIAAAIRGGVAVYDFAPFTRFGQPDSIAESRNGRQVQNHGNGIFAFGILPDEREHAGFTIGSINPVKALWIVVVFPKSGFGQIQLVQVLNEMLETFVVRTSGEERPIEFVVGVPFAALAEFAAHEQEHFSGEKPLVTEQRAKIRKAPPVIAGHAGKQRTFAVDDFIVGKWENEIFVMMIEHRESEIILMELAMDGIVPEINQCIVHPTHVPFEREAEPAEVRRACDLRPRGGFFGDGHDAGKFGVSDVVEFADEINGFKILAAAELVGNPLAFFSGIVEVKHGGDGVYAQAIYVKAVAPEESVGDKEILHFMAAKVENERAPVLVLTFARVFVFVESRAIEAGERPIIAWEMSGHPIDNDANAGLVQGVNEELEIFRWTEAAGGSVEAGDLITPGRVICVFGDGKQFDVGESHLFHVGDQWFGQFAITERFAGRFFAPGTDVDLIDADGSA